MEFLGQSICILVKFLCHAIKLPIIKVSLIDDSAKSASVHCVCCHNENDFVEECCLIVSVYNSTFLKLWLQILKANSFIFVFL